MTLFRRTLSIGEMRWRLAAAAIALASVALGPEVSALVQLVVLVAGLFACLVGELAESARSLRGQSIARSSSTS